MTPTEPTHRPAAYRWALGTFAVLAVATWWRPLWPAEQALHNSLTAVGLVLLTVARRHYRLPLSSSLAVLAFLGLHVVAARWIYSFVPYDTWTDALFGVRLSEVFGWRRNHFDRLVHAAYGAAATVVLLRYLRDRRRLRTRLAAVLTVDIVVSTSALYELFEWGVAAVLAPAAAEAYNGQQGDMWDAHKDMALAGSAALVTVLLCVGLARRTRRDRPAVAPADGARGGRPHPRGPRAAVPAPVGNDRPGGGFGAGSSGGGDGEAVAVDLPGQRGVQV